MNSLMDSYARGCAIQNWALLKTSVPLTRMLGHWWAISGPEMLLSVTLVHCKPEVYLGGPIPLCTLEVIAVLA